MKFKVGELEAVAPITVAGLPDEAYHAGPGISKSGLWTIYSKSPRHWRYQERVETNAFAMGKAVHSAILEPHTYEERYVRGPEDRRGNKWKEACAAAEEAGKSCLTESDFVQALRIRDQAARHPILQRFAKRSVVEASGYAVIGGQLVRCRPDAYHPDLNLILDLKSTTDASADAFARSVAAYGYHAQDAFYTDVWSAANKRPVDGFFFVAIEKTAPYCLAVYELDPNAVKEGRAIYQAALARYAACLAREAELVEKHGLAAHLPDAWPGYGEQVQELSLRPFHYTETQPEELAND